MRVRQPLSTGMQEAVVKMLHVVDVALSSKQYCAGQLPAVVCNGDYRMTNKQLLSDAIALALMAVALILCLFI